MITSTSAIRKLLLAALSVTCFYLAGCSLFSSSPQAPALLSEPQSNTSSDNLYAKALVLWGHEDRCSNPEQAIALLNSVIEKNPHHAEAFLLRGRAYNQLNLAESAFNDLTSSIRICPSANAYAWRGFVLLREGNTRGAWRDIEMALDLDENSRHALNFRGLLRLNEGDMQGACEDFEQGAKEGEDSWYQKARDEGMCS